jgi:hypothetical protein
MSLDEYTSLGSLLEAEDTTYWFIDFIKYSVGTIIRGTLKTLNSQLVTPISTKLQRPDGCD